MLTARASRDDMVAALNAAAAELHTTGTLDKSGNRWRSGIISHSTTVGRPPNERHLEFTIVVKAEIRDGAADTLQVTFKYDATGGFSGFGVTDIQDMAVRTRRHLPQHAL